MVNNECLITGTSVVNMYNKTTKMIHQVQEAKCSLVDSVYMFNLKVFSKRFYGSGAAFTKKT